MNRIKELLARKEKSQLELAAYLNNNKQTVSNWCGNKSQPHLRELYRIANFLDVDIYELLEPRIVIND